MLKFLKKANKLIEGVLFLVLPVVVFYWSLTLVNLDIVKPLISALGSVIDPFIDPIRPFITYSNNYDNMTVDYTILIFATILMCTAFLFTLNGNILDYIDTTLEKVKEKKLQREKIKQQEEERQAYVQEINRNRTIYVILKLIKNAPNEAYLVKDESNDFFSAGIIESYERSIKEAYLKFGGETYNKFSNEENLNCFIFYDINKFLHYLPYLMDRVEEVNKGMLELNIKFDYQVACHCSYSEASAEVDLGITHKILNLAGSKEILLSELLKCRLDTLCDRDFKLFSRGIYLLNDKQMDVYKIQFD